MTLSVKAHGAEIPAIGLGTWELNGEAAIRAVQTALQQGYRHIDTAAMYGNETEIGEAIRTGTTPRADIFVTTKVWPTEVADGRLQRSAEASLKRLQLDRVDLLLIHWPSRDVPFPEQIRALCDAKKRGLARHIGVSNFPPRFVEAAVRYADEPLVTNQVEHHPYLDQREIFAVCLKHGISVTSYAPLGKGAMLDEPAIVEIAREKNKTPAQVVLRWHIEQPMNVAIPKSSNSRRLTENIDIFDFALTPAEMGRISQLARPDGRMVGASVPLSWDSAPHD
jgi:diketogulonate reductase-like aldo/keto reductase